jgi:conjugative transfer signal peptidase TraF
MKFDRKGLVTVTSILAIAAASIVVFGVLGLRINVTSSHVPVGIWRVSPPDKIDVGDVILYDVSEFYAAVPRVREERVHFRSDRILKRVAALAGSLVEMSGDAVAIDGREYPNALVVSDRSWIKVEYPLVVPEGTVWLMADVGGAYDSRYHGPVPIKLIKGKCEPVIVW